MDDESCLLYEEWEGERGCNSLAEMCAAVLHTGIPLGTEPRFRVLSGERVSS
ncbi:hypothetical protein PPACK8108_LOCUS8976 [Phakopsora pachyrhizi]|uniref:Uncharacterized protein n=1 Tax=Phakopsora pachyrhizi TaxID=170000 RepID=A0AAV0AXI0_PHAPC|nr:hypothetical protein PPACK8108_LOCUS8976 [Phakopsora pachyrhizi]